MKVRIQNKGLRERNPCHIDIRMHLSNLHIVNIRNHTLESLRYTIYTDVAYITASTLKPRSTCNIPLNIELINSTWIEVRVYDNSLGPHPIDMKRVHI